jgi:hypothetical protein
MTGLFRGFEPVQEHSQTPGETLVHRWLVLPSQITPDLRIELQVPKAQTESARWRRFPLIPILDQRAKAIPLNRAVRELQEKSDDQSNQLR